jgi:putative addiction module component (TIGR02574 family)
MAPAVEDILNAALKLDDQEKTALVASLLESLDPQMDADVESAWQTEIQKRIHEIEAGSVSLVSWAKVREMFDSDE